MSESSNECALPETQLYSREYVLKAVINALMNVSKDLYNLGLDDLSIMALNMGDQCLNHIDSNKDQLVHPREPGQPFVQPDKVKCSCGCQVKDVEVKVEGQCNGHQTPVGSIGPGVEQEVSEIVSKIRSEQSKR